MSKLRPLIGLAVVVTMLAVVGGSTTVLAAPTEGNPMDATAKVNGQLLSAADGVRRVSAPGTAKAIPGLDINGGGTRTQAASEPPTCWTQFAPTWPAGAEMAHWYRNCNGYTVYAFGGYRSGGTVVDLTGCYIFPDGTWWLWKYSHTNYAGANFSTFPC